MNKHLRAKIKLRIFAQIASLTDELRSSKDPGGAKLRLERLNTALKRLQGDSYGNCFKCESPIQINQLVAAPETMLCDVCLNRTDPQP